MHFSGSLQTSSLRMNAWGWPRPRVPFGHGSSRRRRNTMPDATRHILCMSGGKDSTALALYMRDRVPDMEYVFCDTDKELSETYEYLNRVEAFLGKKIIRLNAKAGFDHWL